MLGSENNFFKREESLIKKDRLLFVYELQKKGFRQEQIDVLLVRYDYFSMKENQHKFDGETIVKDLCIIPGLPLQALNHDYESIVYNVGTSYSCKLLSDILYGELLERAGFHKKHKNRRTIGLILTANLFILYAFVRRGYMTDKQKKDFMNDFKILIT